METQIIVGGGLSGLLAAQLLSENGISFIGLERTDRLGGRAEAGHHRLYDPQNVNFLRKWISDIEWECVNEAPQERRKGEWLPISGEHSDEEQFYLGQEFFIPNESSSVLISRLSAQVGEKFLMQKTVIDIDSSIKALVCQDGSTYPYSKIIWCAPLEQLVKVWRGDKLALLKASKKGAENLVGIHLEFELRSALFAQKNTVVFPFRYKSYLLRALGMAQTSQSNAAKGNVKTDWILFLKRELGEDREEIAKCVRSFKRELQKEFPELKELFVSERIAYFRPLSGEQANRVESLSLGEDLIYLGPQLQIEGTRDSLRNMDRLLENCAHFERELRILNAPTDAS